MFIEKSTIEIKSLEEIRVVGLSLGKLGWPKHGDGGIYPKMWHLFDAEYRAKVKNMIAPFVGYWFWYNEPNDKDGYDYLIGGAVADFEDVDGAMTTFTIPAGRYIRHTFNAEDFGKLVDGALADSRKSVEKWAEENNVKIVNMPKSPTQDIQVYPEVELGFEHPSMYTLTPIE